MIQNKQVRTKKQHGLVKTSDENVVESEAMDQGGQPQVYQVSQLTRDIKAIMEAAFDSIWVEGEISNFRTVASGHSYFVLKDDKSQIRCVLFKGHRAGIKFQPEDGDQVLLFGRITVYDARGEYQIVTESMEPRGLGALQKAFEQLTAKLEKEGSNNSYFFDSFLRVLSNNNFNSLTWFSKNCIRSFLYSNSA